MSVSGASATVSGVVFGGVATSLLGWQWVFWPTVPVGLLLLVVGLRVLPAPGPRTPRGLDLPGAALSTAALVGLVATVVHVGETQRLDRGVLVGAGATGLLLLAFVAWERVASDPLLPGALLRSAALRGGSAGMASDSALYSAIAFITALQLQDQLGLTSAQTGAALLPMSLGIVATGTLLAPRLRRRYGSVRLTVAGLLVGATALGWLAVSSAAPSYLFDVLPALLLMGAALSLATIGAMEHGLGAGKGAHRGVASGVIETSTHVGGAVSVACYASVLAAGADPYLLAYLTAAAFGVAGAMTVAATARGSRGSPAPDA
jgi:predicted MFS family arabinose efflux permease